MSEQNDYKFKLLLGLVLRTFDQSTKREYAKWSGESKKRKKKRRNDTNIKNWNIWPQGKIEKTWKRGDDLKNSNYLNRIDVCGCVSVFNIIHLCNAQWFDLNWYKIWYEVMCINANYVYVFETVIKINGYQCNWRMKTNWTNFLTFA